MHGVLCARVRHRVSVQFEQTGRLGARIMAELVLPSKKEISPITAPGRLCLRVHARDGR